MKESKKFYFKRILICVKINIKVCIPIFKESKQERTILKLAFKGLLHNKCHSESDYKRSLLL